MNATICNAPSNSSFEIDEVVSLSDSVIKDMMKYGGFLNFIIFLISLIIGDKQANKFSSSFRVPMWIRNRISIERLDDRISVLTNELRHKIYSSMKSNNVVEKFIINVERSMTDTLLEEIKSIENCT